MRSLVDIAVSFYEANDAVIHLIYEDADEEMRIIADVSVTAPVPAHYVKGTFVIESHEEKKDDR